MIKDEETVRVLLKILKKDWEKLKVIADAQERSASAQVRMIIRNAIQG